MSFYKLFGFPTALGCLLVHGKSLSCLEPKYFGGGTVQGLNLDWVSLKQGTSQFEYGTLPFLEIIAVECGWNALNMKWQSWSNLSSVACQMAQECRKRMTKLQHKNQVNLVQFYPDSEYELGPIINFNLHKPDGSFVGFTHVAQLAESRNISLRTGCFCNIGFCQQFLGWTDEELKANFNRGHVCGDNLDLIDRKPTGSIRISFGLNSEWKDLDEWIEFLSLFMDPALVVPTSLTEMYLKKIILYPIKSCGGYEVGEWRMNEQGLWMDRHWMIVNAQGIGLTQRKHPKLAFVKIISLKSVDDQIMVKIAYENDEIVITDKMPVQKKRVKVCIDQVECLAYEDDQVSKWFENIVKIPCKLVRYNPDNCRVKSTQKNFCNDAPILMVNYQSIRQVYQWMSFTPSLEPLELFAIRFRPNLIVDGDLTAFCEDEWIKKTLNLQQVSMQVTKKCQRCFMVCVNQTSGVLQTETFQHLVQGRDIQGKVVFGIYLQPMGEVLVKCGSVIELNH